MLPAGRPSHRALALLTLALAACTSVRSPEADAFTWRLDLSVDATAAIVAGAARAATGGNAASDLQGAPVLAAGKAWRIVYVPDRDGELEPCASHRLRLVAGAVDHAPEVRARSVGPVELAPVAHGDPAIELTVRGDGAMTLVQGRVLPRLRRPLADALALAENPEAALPGLAEPNLAVLVTAMLLQRGAAAEADDDHERAFALRRRAADLGQATASVLLQLGDHEAARGDDTGAQEHYLQAIGRTDDPVLRGTLGARLRELAQGNHLARDWRRRARSCLGDDDLARAALLLHRARRDGDEPVADYRLLGELHRRRTEPMAAFASDLLAREHERDCALAAKARHRPAKDVVPALAAPAR